MSRAGADGVSDTENVIASEARLRETMLSGDVARRAVVAGRFLGTRPLDPGACTRVWRRCNGC